jgi:hypothetical protein
MQERIAAREEAVTPLVVQEDATRHQMAHWALANSRRRAREVTDLFSKTDVVIAVVPHEDTFSCFPIKGRLKMEQLALAGTSCQKIEYENGATLINKDARVTITAIACGTFEMAEGLMRIAQAAERRAAGNGRGGGSLSRLGNVVCYAGLLCGALLLWMFYNNGHALSRPGDGAFAAIVAGVPCVIGLTLRYILFRQNQVRVKEESGRAKSALIHRRLEREKLSG